MQVRRDWFQCLVEVATSLLAVDIAFGERDRKKGCCGGSNCYKNDWDSAPGKATGNTDSSRDLNKLEVNLGRGVVEVFAVRRGISKCVSHRLEYALGHFWSICLCFNTSPSRLKLVLSESRSRPLASPPDFESQVIWLEKMQLDGCMDQRKPPPTLEFKECDESRAQHTSLGWEDEVSSEEEIKKMNEQQGMFRMALSRI
jgi:hypothetical protein